MMGSVQEVIPQQKQENYIPCITALCIGHEKVKLPNNTITGMILWSMKNGTLEKMQLVTNTTLKMH